MTSIKIITVGSIKESFYREACAEYIKRLTPFCRVEVVELKESPLPDDPSRAQIDAALRNEGERILAAVPPRAVTVALCIEGTECPSEELAHFLDAATSESGSLCFIIGSSYGLAQEVKQACRKRLSFSKMTFPHQLMRVILLEQLYRGEMINAHRRYHK